MARRNKNSNNRRSDETFDFSSEAAPAKPKKFKKTFAPKVTHTAPKLSEIEDRRTWHPSGKTRPARSLTRSQHQLKIATKRHTSPRSTDPVHKKIQRARDARLPHRVQFDAPENVLVCIRRKQRKQVLFALRKTGKGARARRHRQSYYSSIGC